MSFLFQKQEVHVILVLPVVCAVFSYVEHKCIPELFAALFISFLYPQRMDYTLSTL